MENRIDRRQDECLYQPKIHSQRIRSLYQLKNKTGKPMTVLLDQAIRELSESYSTYYHPELDDEPIFEKVEEETWDEIVEYRRLLDELDCLKFLEESKK